MTEATDNKGLTNRRPGLGTLVLLGFGLGIFCGLFFGEMATVLEGVGRIYIRLLQMAIVPYIAVSLIAGLGRLTPLQASRIALWGGAVLLLILACGLIVMLMLPLAYPDWEAASYFSSSLLSSEQEVDFISLYISANPFDSLANTVVPAIVLFSIIMGVAVMFSDRKKPLLELLLALDDALMNITRFMVKLAPFGIFAIAANAAGKLELAEFDRLQVFVWSYLILWALLFFALLPGLLVAMTPVSYRELFSSFRISFITAFVTGSMLVVLPMMIEEIRNLLARHNISDDETDATVDVLIPTTFNFPSVAMLLVLSFILFAAWYSGSPLTVSNYPLFVSMGLFVAFGGSNIALPFLLNLFQLPADLFDLFLVANVLTNFFFMALGAMNLVVLTLISVFLIKGRATPKVPLLAALFVLLIVGTPLLLKGSALLMNTGIGYEYRGYQNFVAQELGGITVPVQDIEYQSEASVHPEGSRLQRATSSGWLRIGHSSDALPWAFRNELGTTVGFDIQLLHAMAADLGVGLQIMRLDPDQVSHALNTGQIDLYASGMLLDTAKVREFEFSKAYSNTTLGLLLADYKRQEYSSINDVIAADDNAVGLLQSPSSLRQVELILSEHDFVDVYSPRDFLQGKIEGLEALLMSVEAASAWTLVYPEFTAIIPKGRKVTIPLVFGLPSDDPQFKRYVDTWIDSASAFGFMEVARDRWILGKKDKTAQPRWSIIRNVLHWVE
jgi:Na+/H+-dicarboxylate symporter/ABC-type amino acid transport substrate-binding protein